MRNLIIGLCLIILGKIAYSTVSFDLLLSNQVVLDQGVSIESTEQVWSQIVKLDKYLPKGEVINLYLSSNGGDSQAIVVLLERINELQNKGRFFSGTIYGYCYSVCGSLFAIMDFRYMTENAVYMQHASYTRYPSPTNNLLLKLIDNHRLKYDAKMLDRNLADLIKEFKTTDIVGNARQMYLNGRIDAIVPQPIISR